MTESRHRLLKHLHSYGPDKDCIQSFMQACSH